MHVELRATEQLDDTGKGKSFSKGSSSWQQKVNVLLVPSRKLTKGRTLPKPLQSSLVEPCGEAELLFADLQIQQCQFACSVSYQGLLCLEGTSAEQVISFLLLNEAMVGYLNGPYGKETL